MGPKTFSDNGSLKTHRRWWFGNPASTKPKDGMAGEKGELASSDPWGVPEHGGQPSVPWGPGDPGWKSRWSCSHCGHSPEGGWGLESVCKPIILPLSSLTRESWAV